MEQLPFPNKKYGIIYADPPWNYSDKKCSGAAAVQYRCMKVEDICALPVKDIAADDCVLFLWTTYPMLKEALKVIEAWGFTYKSIAFQWLKLNRSGFGFFLRFGTVDTRQYRTLPFSGQGQACADQQQRKSAYFRPRAAAQPKAHRNPRPHYPVDGGGTTRA